MVTEVGVHRVSQPTGPCAETVIIWCSLVILGSFWVGNAANQTDSWNRSCYAANNCDSLTFSVVGELLWAGHTPYDEDVRRAHIARTRLEGAAPPFDLPFQYPPNSLPVFAVRALLPPHAAHVLFSVATTFLYLALLAAYLYRDLADGLVGGSIMAAMSIGALSAFNGQLGQTGALAGALLVGVVLLWKRSPVAAGALLGVLAFKPQYAIAIGAIAIVHGHRRILLGAMGSLFAMTVISGLAFGFDQWREFLGVLDAPNHTVPFMINWMGLAWRVAPNADWIASTALPVFAGATVILSLVLWRVRHVVSVEGQLAVATVLALCVSPNAHPYDLLVLGPAIAYVAKRRGGLLVAPLAFVTTWLLLPPPQRWALAVVLVLFGVWSAAILRQEAHVSPEANASLS